MIRRRKPGLRVIWVVHTECEFSSACYRKRSHLYTTASLQQGSLWPRYELTAERSTTCAAMTSRMHCSWSCALRVKFIRPYDGASPVICGKKYTQSYSFGDITMVPFSWTTTRGFKHAPEKMSLYDSI